VRGLILFGLGAVRALGLDIGSKTVGLALTDEARIAAHPLDVLARKGIAQDVPALAQLVRANDVSDVIYGLPLELSGRVGHRARRVLELVDALRAALPDVNFHDQDERFTTAEAERVLIDADLSRSRRKQVIDQQAAVLILQGWLDRQRTE
jgi:putative Holliday junction resolvase